MVNAAIYLNVKMLHKICTLGRLDCPKFASQIISICTCPEIASKSLEKAATGALSCADMLRRPSKSLSPNKVSCVESELKFVAE